MAAIPNKSLATQSPIAKVSSLLHELRLHDDASEVRLFIDLCRTSLRVRTWLFSRFAREPKTQTAFRAFLRDPARPANELWSAALTREVLSAPERNDDGPFGGLSESAIWRLIQQLQAGRIDIMAFILVRMWRQLAVENRAPPAALWRATLEHWHGIASAPDDRAARDVARAVAFFADKSPDAPVSDESWKVHVLLYILDHPRPRYRVGELFDNLPAKFRRTRANGNSFVERRELRKFCEQNGIRRDQRAGRPNRSFSRSSVGQRSSS